jgi:hypothetical protein
MKISGKKYMSTGWLVSWPITLKICEVLDLILIHRHLLAFCPPVPGFCAVFFTLTFDELGHRIKTRHWPCLSFDKRVDINEIKMFTNFQLNMASLSQVTALDINHLIIKIEQSK